MTREEAIAILKAHHMWTGEPQEIIDVRKENKALQMAIQALSQEPCDDAVSREAVIMECIKYADHEHNVQFKKEVSETRKHDAQVIIYACDYFKTFVEKLPSVTHKSGKWILTIEDWNKWACSNCGYVKRTDIHVNIGWKYCPNCGADMRGEK